MGHFYEEFDITWGEQHATILDNGKLLTLNLDQICGSGFQSKRSYLFGRIDMQLKLVSGDSAGTVTAYYVNSSTIFDIYNMLPIQSKKVLAKLNIYTYYGFSLSI